MVPTSMHDTVTPINRAVAAELATRPPGGQEIEAFEGLNRALLHRASLDDQVRDRRQERAQELHAHVDALLPGAPAELDALLALLCTSATTIATRVSAQPDLAQLLRDIVALLVDTDLPDVSTTAPENARDDSTFYQATATPSMTESRLLECLREHAAPDLELRGISDLHVLSGGFSKEMLAVTVEHTRGSDELVIRKVAPGRTAETLAGEYAVLEFAWSHGVPVAEPLWLDEHALGSPSFATRRAAGKCFGDVWGPTEPVSRDAGISIASALARLHSINTTTLTGAPLPPMASQAEIAAALDERQQVLETIADPTAPFAALFALVLGWLRARTPGDVPRPVLVHGDFGLHNLLLEGSEVSAVLDWERAHLGHAAEDLTYVRPSIESVLDWDEFLEAYRAAGGQRPEVDRLDFYAVWHDLWRGVSAYRIRTKFVQDPDRLSDAMAGLLMTPRFLLRAAQTAFGLQER